MRSYLKAKGTLKKWGAQLEMSSNGNLIATETVKPFTAALVRTLQADGYFVLSTIGPVHQLVIGI